MKPVIGITLDYLENDPGYSDFPWYALRRDYSRILTKHGAIPIFLSMESYEIDFSILNLLDGILIPGCDLDVPPSFYGEEVLFQTKPAYERSAGEKELILAASSRNMPILGICHGMQLLNVAFGGSLYQSIKD